MCELEIFIVNAQFTRLAQAEPLKVVLSVVDTRDTLRAMKQSFPPSLPCETFLAQLTWRLCSLEFIAIGFVITLPETKH
jgi:hypothetical protein